MLCVDVPTLYVDGVFEDSRGASSLDAARTIDAGSPESSISSPNGNAVPWMGDSRRLGRCRCRDSRGGVRRDVVELSGLVRAGRYGVLRA